MEVCYRVFAGKEFEWVVGLIYLIGFSLEMVLFDGEGFVAWVWVSLI